MKDALLILAQGSPVRYTEPFLSGIWDQVNHMTPFQWVELCFTEREQDCFAAVERLADCGVLSIVIAPLFLMDAQTEKRRVMDIFGKLGVRNPGVSFNLAKSVTADTQIAGMITEMAMKAAQL